MSRIVAPSTRAPFVLAPLLLALAWMPALEAQEDPPADPPSPAEEPSALDTLFEQTDLGNVVQVAQSHYHAGVRQMRQGEKLAEKARAASEPAEREKLEARATTAYEGAIEELSEAIRFQPDLVEAYVALGRSYAALGRHAEALKVHAVALQRRPEDGENFQGWADAALALDMLGDATTAYDALVATRPEQASYLMQALSHWLERRRLDPGGLEPAAIERLAGWIEQRQGG